MSDEIFIKDIDPSVDKCVCFQLVNPKDGTRTHVVTLRHDEIVGVLEKSPQDVFINVMSLDTTLNPDPSFCLHPLVRVGSFLKFYKEHFVSINDEGVNDETV